MAVTYRKTVAGSLIITMTQDGVRETARAFDKLGDDAQDELKKEAQKIAEKLVSPLRAAAAGDGAQSALLAPTVKTIRSRVPTVIAGGGTSVGRQGEPAGGLVFSSEFGQNKKSGWYGAPRYRRSRGRQWHRGGNPSYWFFEEIDGRKGEIFRQWFTALDRLLARWGAGG